MKEVNMDAVKLCLYICIELVVTNQSQIDQHRRLSILRVDLNLKEKLSYKVTDRLEYFTK